MDLIGSDIRGRDSECNLVEASTKKPI
jgi:hypothetical protein